MKKFIQAFVVVLCLGITTTLNAQNDQALIGKARGAAHECLAQFEGNYEINAFVDVTGICFVSGNTYRVTFSAGPKCPPNHICPLFIILVATVEFDCDGNVTYVSCGL
jgi:hypothetical protein